jgi:short subunit dehydrogenase-like uncharacterized protein
LSDQNAPSGRIVLFGATGYTGDLAARAMAKRGMKPVLAARRREAVEALAGELGGLESATADVADPASVRALVEKGDVLVSTVGPFARWGDAALDAAIDSGAHYVDSTGEPPFVRNVFETAGPRAEAAGSLLLTAMGYDWIPGNLTGGLALEQAGGAATGVRIGYFTKGGGLGGMSGGTRASAVGALIEPSFHYRDGRIVTERGARRVHEFDIGGRGKPGISVGTSEAFSLPRAFPGVRDVEVYLGWFAGASRPMQAFSLAGAAVAKVPGVTSAMSAAAGRFVKTSTGGPDAEARAATGSRFVAEALGASGEVLATVRTEGVNGYTFTGEALAWAAERVAAGGSDGAGALGPVEAFGLEALEAGVAECGISRA